MIVNVTILGDAKKNAPTFETLPFPHFMLKKHVNSEIDKEICYGHAAKHK